MRTELATTRVRQLDEPEMFGSIDCSEAPLLFLFENEYQINKHKNGIHNQINIIKVNTRLGVLKYLKWFGIHDFSFPDFVNWYTKHENLPLL